MSVTTLLPLRERTSRLRGLMAGLGIGLLAAARSKAAPVAGHIREHGYSIAGLGCVSGAAFVHSVFSGLLVTGLLFLVFEWKVSELWAMLGGR